MTETNNLNETMAERMIRLTADMCLTRINKYDNDQIAKFVVAQFHNIRTNATKTKDVYIEKTSVLHKKIRLYKFGALECIGYSAGKIELQVYASVDNVTNSEYSLITDVDIDKMYWLLSNSEDVDIEAIDRANDLYDYEVFSNSDDRMYILVYEKEKKLDRNVTMINSIDDVIEYIHDWLDICKSSEDLKPLIRSYEWLLKVANSIRSDVINDFKEVDTIIVVNSGESYKGKEIRKWIEANEFLETESIEANIRHVLKEKYYSDSKTCPSNETYYFVESYVDKRDGVVSYKLKRDVVKSPRK